MTTTELGVTISTSNVTKRCTSEDLKITMWINTLTFKEYTFTVNYLPDSPPTFSSTVSEVVFNIGYSYTYTFPAATPSGGNTVKYELISIHSPTIKRSFPDTSVPTVTFGSIDSADSGQTYAGYALTAYNDGGPVCGTDMVFDVRINSVPATSNTYASSYDLLIHVNSTLSFNHPHFTDVDGDSVTTSIEVTPASGASFIKLNLTDSSVYLDP